MKTMLEKAKNRFAILTLAAALVLVGLQSFTTTDTTDYGTDGCSSATCGGLNNFCCQTTNGGILFKN